MAKVEYNKFTKLTEKMLKTREVVDRFINDNNKAPSYSLIARKLRLDRATVYYRLRGYRDKMRSKVVSK